MEKKILLLRASTGWKDPSPPMAFAYLGAIAKQKGFKVIVENLNAQYSKTTVEDVIKLIKEEKPMVVGVTIFTNYAKDSYELIKKIKPYCNLLIAGGPHVTIYPEEVIEKGVDIAVIGEAENSFPSLLKILYLKKDLKMVNGIVYKDRNNKIIRTKPQKPINLDEILLPDKEIFRKEDYVKVKEEINNFGGVLTSRGCPGRCTYCYHSLFGREFRYRSAKNVFEEVLYLHKKYGITHINFIDDAFTVNKERLIELCNFFIKARLPLEWVCATRIDFLDKETIIMMKKAGCIMISLGVESFIPYSLIKMKKTGNPDWYINRVNDILLWCYESKIRVGLNILTGFPWNTVKEIREMQKHIKKIKKYVTQGFCGGVLQPMPNTEDYEKYAKEYGFEKWWLNKKVIFREDYHPFFMLFYHVFWEQLHNNFFNLDDSVFKEIDKLYRMIGKWNLWVIVKRRIKNRFIKYTVYSSLFILSNLSLLIFNISPKLEKRLMKPFVTFSYKFKFKK